MVKKPLKSGCCQSVHLFAPLPIILALALAAYAAPRTWTGIGSDDFWTTTANWGGIAPAAGDSLIFAGSTRLTPDNNIAAATSFVGITFGTGASPFTLSGNSITLSGDIVNNSTNLQTINFPLIIAAGRTLAATSGNIMISGSISGSGGLTKTGSNILTLSGSSNYSGGTTLSSGTLNINSSTALGSGPFVIQGGTIDNTSGGSVTLSTAGTQTWTGDFSYGGGPFGLNTGAAGVILTANRTVTVTANTLSIGGAISGGAYSLSKAGAGTLVLAGSNTYSSATIVSAGTLIVTGSTVAGSTVTVNNGATLAGTGSVGSITLANGSTIAPGTGGASIDTLTASNVTFSTTSTYSIDLDGITSTYDQINSTGIVNCSGGALFISSISNPVPAKEYIIINAATVTGSFPGLAHGTQFSAQGRLFTITYTSTQVKLTDNGASSSPVWNGGGGDNNWTTGANWGGTAPVAYDNLQFGGVVNLNPFNNFTSGTSFGNISFNAGAGAFTLGGTSIVLTGDITNASTSLQTSNLAMTINGTRTVNAVGADIVLAGNISGSGGLTKAGTQTLVLTGTHGYSGTTTISAGTLSIGSGATDGSINSTNNIVNNGALFFNTTGTQIFGKSVSGTGTFTKTGSGTVTLTSSSTYSGPTTLAMGTLRINNASAIGTGQFIINGGTIDNASAGDITLSNNNTQIWGGDFTYNGGTRSLNMGTGAVTLTSSRTLTVNGNTLTIGGGIAGNHTLTKAGSGTLTLSGSDDNAGLSLAANVGTVNLAKSSSGSVHAVGGGLTVAGGSVYLGGSGGDQIRNDATVTVNSGTFNMYGFSETIDALTGSGGYVNNSGGGTSTLTVGSNSGSGTYAGIIQNTSGTLALTKVGTGTQTLAGTNTYSGATTVDIGALLITGFTTSTITVNNGATLGGSGTSSGPVTMNSGSILSPGVAGTGLFATGSLTLSSTSTFAVEINGAANYDQVAVTGGVNLGNAALSITLGYNPTPGQTITIVNNDGSDAIIGTFNGFPEGSIVGASYSATSYQFKVSYVGGSGNDVVLTVESFTLTVTGLAAQNKAYDGTTTATFTGGTLVGVHGGDDVFIGIVTGTFVDKNVGTSKNVTVSGISLSGTDAANYTVTNPTGLTADITAPSALTITGMTASNKVYDGTTSATLVGGTLSGAVGGDAVNFTGGTGTFADKNVGVSKSVTVSGITLTGTDAANYTVTQPTGLTANITAPSALTITGMTAQNKVYDGTTTASFTGGTLNGVQGSDIVTIGTVTGTFADKSVGISKTVTVSTITLSGADAANYTVTNPTGLTANITAPSALTITGMTAQNKVYDGTTSATLVGGTLSGVLGGDIVTFTGGTGIFTDKNVGVSKSVTVTGITLTGTDAANYTVTQPTGLTANITAPSALTITGMTAQNKVYDGTTSATLVGGTLSGVLGGDIVTFTGGTGTFADKNVGAGKSVTITGISLTGTDAANYTVTQPTGLTANITAPSVLTITGMTAQNKVYDGTTSATLVGGTLGGVLGGDIVTFTGGTGTFADKNVGAGKSVTVTGITLTGTDAANYTVTNPTGLTANITAPSALTITGMTASNKVYDGTTSATLVGGTLSGVVGGDIVTFTGGTGTFADKNVGVSKPVTVTGITLTGTDAANYTVTQPTGLTANITVPSALTITGMTAQNKIYDGTTSATLVGGTLSGVLGGDIVTFTGGTGTFANKNVGASKSVTVTGITLTGTDAANYTVTQPTGLTANITAPSALTITGMTAQNKVYDGTTSATLVGGTLSGVLGGDIVTFTGGTGTFADKNVGAGKSVTVTGITLTGTDAANYTVTQPTGLTANITAPSALTITGMTAQNKVYDGTTSATLVGGTLSGVLGGDIVTFTGGTGTFANKNVGAGKSVMVTGITLTGTDAANYTVTQPTGLTANITAPSALTITGMTASNKVYDGTTSATLVGGTLSGVLGGDIVSFTGGTGTFADKNVGAGKSVTVTGITLTGTDAANYTVTQPTGLTANITAPSALTITGMTASNKVYDGTTSATLVGGTLSGVLGGDIVSFTGGTGTFADKNVGVSKPVTVSGITLTGTDAANYTVTQPTGLTANITAPSALTITGMTAQNKIYDGTTSATLVGGTLSGVVGGDIVTFTGGTGTFADKNVGVSKPVTVTGISLAGTDAANYTVTQPTGLTANITAPSALTITGMTAQNKVYDGTTSASFTGGTLNGVQGSDIVTIGTVTGTFADKSVGISKTVTVSTITLTGADAANYTVTNPTGLTANITALSALTITGMTAQNKVYDGTTSATLVGGTLSGVVGGDIVTFTGGTGTFADKNVGAGKSVTVTGITLTGADAGNYALTQPAGLTAAITRASLTITAKDTSKIYGGIDPMFSGTITGFVGGDDSSAALTGSPTYLRDPGENAGVYPIRPSGVTAANYAISFINGVFTINKAGQAIYFAPLAPVHFGDVPFKLTGTASTGLPVAYASSDAGVATVSNDTITITGVGAAVITATQGGSVNYTAAVPVQQTLTVIPSIDTVPPVNNVTLIATALDTGRVTLAWNPSAITAPDADSVGIWYKATGYPLSWDEPLAQLVGRYPKLRSIDTVMLPVAATLYFGLAVRDTAGNWSAITVNACDTATAVAKPGPLTYHYFPILAHIGIPIVPDTCGNSGGVADSFTITPDPPAGLQIGRNTGILSGTPIAVSPQGRYIIRAMNRTGADSTVVAITVSPPAPGPLHFTRPALACTVGVAIAPNTLINAGGPVDTVTITPPLPRGFVIDGHTGTVTGTPLASLADIPHIVTAMNASGSAVCTLSITVAYPKPKAAFAAQPPVGAAPLSVNFSDTSTGFIDSRQWSFGDGLPDSIVGTADISHTYLNAGGYTVRLIVRGPGGVDTLSRTGCVTVTDTTPPPPVSNLSVLALNCSTAVLSWSPSISIDADSIAWCVSVTAPPQDPAAGEFRRVLAALETSDTVRGLPPGGTVLYAGVFTKDIRGNRSTAARVSMHMPDCVPPRNSLRATLASVGDTAVQVSITTGTTQTDARELAWCFSGQAPDTLFDNLRFTIAPYRDTAFTVHRIQIAGRKYLSTIVRDSSGNLSTVKIDSVMVLNKPPVFVSRLRDTVVNEDAQMRLTFAANDWNDDTVFYSLREGPRGATVDSMRGVFAWTPDNSAVGANRIVVSCADRIPGNTALDTVIITVVNVNEPPRVTIVGDTVIAEDRLYRALVQISDRDPGDTARVFAVDLPPWLTLSGDTIHGIPTNEQIGDYTLRIIAADDAGLRATATLSLRVVNGNDTPLVQRVVAPTAGYADSVFAMEVFAYDVDAGDSLSFEWQTKPRWLALTGVTTAPQLSEWRFTLAGTPGGADTGQVPYAFVVKDRAGATALVSDHLRIIARPNTVIGRKQVAYGSARYVLRPSNSPDTGVSFVTKLTSLADSSVIERTVGQTAALEYYPLVDGRYVFTARAVDSRGLRENGSVVDTLVIENATTHIWPGDSSSWQMISAPLVSLNADSVRGSGYLVTWDESRPERDIYGYYVPSRDIRNMTGGRSYWRKSPDTVDVAIDRENLVDSAIDIRLSKAQYGWNMIANPYVYPVAWNGNLQAWKWNGADFEPADSVLDPWQGYWVMAESATVVTLDPKPKWPDGPGLRAKSASAYWVGRNEWRLKVSLAGSGVVDGENAIGNSAAASDGFDRADLYEPPRMQGQGYLFFPHPEWKKATGEFASDIRKTWDSVNMFEVGIAPWEGSDSAKVWIDGYGSLSGMYLFVRSAAGLSEYDAANGISLPPSKETRYLTLIVTADRDLARKLPVAFLCGNPYPNPGRSATRIRYTLPYEWDKDGRLSTSSYTVKIVIYDIAGRRIRDLVNHRRSAGSYEAIWDCKMNTGRGVSPGLFMYSIEAGRYRAVKQITVVR